MKAKRYKDPLTGKLRWQHPTKEELQAYLEAKVEHCIKEFQTSRALQASNQYRNLKYRLKTECGVDAKPLY